MLQTSCHAAPRIVLVNALSEYKADTQLKLIQVSQKRFNSSERLAALQANPITTAALIAGAIAFVITDNIMARRRRRRRV